MKSSQRKEPAARDRNAAFEWLRILCMLSIVAYHYSIWGFYEEELLESGNKILVDLIGMPLGISLQLFVLISGYHMSRQRFTLKKLLHLMGTLWFYSLGAAGILFLADRQALSGTMLRQALFPLTRQAYWFISFYTALMLCSPFLNRLMQLLDRRRHALLCLLSVLLCFGLPFVLDGLSGGTLSVFLTLYLCAGFVRAYGKTDRQTSRRCLLLALLLLAAYAAWIAARNIRGLQSGEMELLLGLNTHFWRLNSPLVLAPALLLLCAAAAAEPKPVGPVSKLGALTLGVYLFQSNDIVSRFLWQSWLHTRSYTDSPLLFLHALVSIAGIFAAGLLIEALRRATVGRLWSRLADRIAPPLEALLDAALERLLSALGFFLGGERS